MALGLLYALVAQAGELLGPFRGPSKRVEDRRSSRPQLPRVEDARPNGPKEGPIETVSGESLAVESF